MVTKLEREIQEIEAAAGAAGMSRERMLRLAEFIESHSDDFRMEEWQAVKDGKIRRALQACGLAKAPACRTTRYIAGWAVALFGDDNASGGNVPAQAQEVLGLTYAQSMALFYDFNWPEQFSDNFNDSSDFHDAWTAGQRIRHMVTTGE